MQIVKQCNRRNQLLLFSAAFFLLMQPCAAQPLPADSLLKQSKLFQRGKANIRVGGVLLGVGITGIIIGAATKTKRPQNGWNFGPNGSEMAYILGGTVGFVGLVKLLQGAARIERAKAELNLVSYWQAPEQQGQMPALTLRWEVGRQRYRYLHHTHF